MRRGEYKVAGGKLVAADVAVIDGIIREVFISGDFFLEPDEALENMNQALVGIKEDASVSEMSALVAASVGSARMIGFTPDAVAIAVRRALGFATGWADHVFEIVHPEPFDPVLHIALDQVLTENVANGTRKPTLRLWEWTGRTVVIGSFQSVRNEVDLDAAREMDVKIVRRISGGGAMFMEPGNCITFSLYVPASLVEGLSFEQSYSFLDDWVLGGLNELGVAASYKPLNDITSPLGKIGGAAQKRMVGGGVLHHVTMSYDIDAQKMVQVLRIGREKLSDKGTKSAVKRVDPIRSQTGMARDDVISSLKDHFRARYDTVDGQITDEEWARARELAQTKFATDEWTYRIP